MENLNTGIDDKIKNKIIRIVNALTPESKIYLYGSRARGDYSSRSDIDIAIDAGCKLPRENVGEIRDILAASNIIYKIDVVDMNNISEDMYKNILEHRIIWKN